MATQGPLTRAVAAALKDAPLLPRDSGAVALAKRYAAAIDGTPDDPELLDTLGPKLLAVLVQLGMTPAGRGAKGGGKDGSSVPSELEKARARRAQRSG